MRGGYIWPGAWRAHGHPDPVPDVVADPNVDALNGYQRRKTASACQAADRSEPRLSEHPTGPTWKVADARREPDEAPLVWLDGGLDVRTEETT